MGSFPDRIDQRIVVKDLADRDLKHNQRPRKADPGGLEKMHIVIAKAFEVSLER